MAGRATRVLWVETRAGGEGSLAALRVALVAANFVVTRCDSVDAALACSPTSYDCILADSQFAGAMSAAKLQAPIVLLAGDPEFEHANFEVVPRQEATAWVMQRAAQRAMERRILDRERAETRLMLERCHVISERARDIILFVRTDGVVIEANRAATMAYGYSRDELIGLSLWELRAPSTHAKLPLDMKKADQGGVLFETVHRRKDGTEFPVEVSSVGTNVGGEHVLLSVVRDISTRKLVEDALREREGLLRLFVEAAPAAIAMFDREMRYVAVSRRYRDDYRLGELDVIGRSHYDVFPVMPAKWKEIHARCMAGAVERCEEDAFDRSSGETDWLRWEVRPWHDAKGEIGGIVLFSEMVTEQKRAQDAMQQLLKDLEHFAYAAGHDLQAPLRTVRTFVQMLGRELTGEESERVREILLQIESSATRMQGLVDGLLAFAKAGQVSDAAQPLSLNEPLRAALADLQTQVRESGAIILVEPLPVLEVHFAHMEQLFQNLIGNALKYRRAGVAPQVRIYAERHDSDWVIRVRDNGQGFDPKYSERIFAVFERLHGHDVNGSGLGLATCRRIIELHGGRIWADAIPGEGATFSFALPVKVAAEVELATALTGLSQ